MGKSTVVTYGATTNSYTTTEVPYPEAQQASVSSFKTNITTVDENTTLDTSMNTVLVDATSGNITITLPAAAGVKGIEYTVKKIDAGANTVTLDGNASETINGTATFVLSTQYEFASIKSDGTNWVIIDSYSASAGTFTTATITTANCTTVDTDALVADGIKLKVVAKTAAYTATDTDFAILVSCAATPYALTLPAGTAGRMYFIKKTDANTNAITVTPNGSEKIDGAATAVLDTQYDSILLVSNGSNWFSIAKAIA